MRHPEPDSGRHQARHDLAAAPDTGASAASGRRAPPRLRALQAAAATWAGPVLVVLSAVVLFSLYFSVHLLLGRFAVTEIGGITLRANTVWRPIAFFACAVLAWIVVWQIALRASTREGGLSASSVTADAAADARAGARTAVTTGATASTIASSRAWTIFAWTIGGGTVAIAWLWCLVVVSRTPGTAYPVADGALLELYTRYASEGLFGVGPYSRFGWHHPGPIFFYAIVPFYLASQASALALNVGAFAINIATLATMGWAAVRYGGAALATMLAVAVGWYLLQTQILLPSAWNPHIVLLPLALLIVGGAIVASGRLSMLPATTAAGSFVAQTYVALVPLAAIVAAFAIAAGLRRPVRAPGARSPWTWLAVSIAVGFVLWLPPLIEQVSPGGGNFGAIVRFFVAPDATEEALPRDEAITTWATTWSAAVRPGLRAPFGEGIKVRKDTETSTLVTAAVLLLFVTGSWAARRGRRVEAWCCRLSGIASIVAFVAIARIRGGLADHLVSWVTMIGLMSVASLAAVACIWIGERLRGRGFGGRPFAQRLAAAVTIALLVGCVFAGARRLEVQRRDQIEQSADANRANHARRERSTVETFSTTIRAFMERAHVRKPVITVHGDTWALTAGVVLQLHKQGVPFAVSQNDVWMFGTPLAPRGGEDVHITIADRDARPILAARESNCMLIERHGTSIHVLLSSLKELVPLTCE